MIKNPHLNVIIYQLIHFRLTNTPKIECIHWEKSWENFGKMLYVSQSFPIFFSKWANYAPILRKKWENFGKHTKFSRNFLAISPSVMNEPILSFSGLITMMFP